MATIKIMSAQRGSFPAQKAQLVLGQLTVKTSVGGQKIYTIKSAITSVTTVSEHKNDVVFDIVFNDGSTFRGEASRKIVHELTKYVGAKSSSILGSSTRGVTEKTKEQANKQTIITLSILLPVCYILYQCTGSSPDAPSRDSNLESKKIEAVIKCKDFAKNSLKAPKTAEFPWSVAANVIGSEYFTVNSYVDAQNSFGALIRTNYHCALTYQGGGVNGWKLEEFKVY